MCPTNPYLCVQDLSKVVLVIMNADELATYLGITKIELARQMIDSAIRLSEVVMPRQAGENYTREELSILGRAVNRVLFNEPTGVAQGRTYERFWDGERFENTRILYRLCAYILHMQGNTYDQPGEEPGDIYWFRYCQSITGQPSSEATREDVPIQQVNIIRRYRAYFFSHIRYNVWDKGTIQMEYTAENSGTVSGSGFYRGKDDAFKGTFEIRGNHICMDLQGHSKPNWFRLIGKVDGDKMQDAPYFRAAYVTVSSYPSQYTSAIEAIFLEETFAIENPLEEEKVRRYLMLQRHRFQSEMLATNQLLMVSPSNLGPNDLEGIIGSYACISRIDDQILVSSLVIDKIYRTTFRTKIYQKNSREKNNQLCYLELMPAGALNYIHIKGYLAAVNMDEPNLQCIVSTLIIPMNLNNDMPTKGTFNSLVEIDGKEILWAGDCYLIKLNEQEEVIPFMCHVKKLSKEDFPNDNENLYNTIHSVIIQ